MTRDEWLAIVQRDDVPGPGATTAGHDRRALIAAVRAIVRDLKAGYEADSWRRATRLLEVFDTTDSAGEST